MESRPFSALFYLALIVGLIVANVLVYRAVFASDAPSIQTLAVTKGDATLIRTGQGLLLIDTGADASILRALGEALPPWQRSISAVILTSDKTAQSGGLASVQERYQVGQVLRVGTKDLPYGSRLMIGDMPVTIIGPGNYVPK